MTADIGIMKIGVYKASLDRLFVDGIRMKTELLTSTANETFKFLTTSYRRLFTNIFKVKLISSLVLVLTLVLSFVSFMGAMGFVPLMYLIMLLIAIAIFFIGLFMSFVADSVGYNVVDAVFKDQGVGFWESFRKNMLPMLKFVLISLLIATVALSPVFVLYFIIYAAVYVGESSTAGILLVELIEILLRILSSIIQAVLYLFLQFTVFELLIARKGAIESFKQSFGIVKENFIETIVFSFVLWGIGTVIGIPFIIVGVVLVFGGLLLGAGGGGLLMLPLIFMGVLIFIVLLLIYSTITVAVVLSAQYVYWNKIKRAA